MKAESREATRRLNYDVLVAAIGEVHRQAQAGAAGAVNRHHVLRNWVIGAYIVEYEQNGEDRATYGSGLLKRLSADLQQRGVAGTSPDMLERMRLFFNAYPQLRGQISVTASRKLPGTSTRRRARISATLSRKSPASMPTPLPGHELGRLSWSHFVEFIQFGDPWKRAFAAAARVAPRAGAWIETFPSVSDDPLPRSPPARGRGLKRRSTSRATAIHGRPPRGGVD